MSTWYIMKIVFQGYLGYKGMQHGGYLSPTKPNMVGVRSWVSFFATAKDFRSRKPEHSGGLDLRLSSAHSNSTCVKEGLSEKSKEARL